MIAAIRPAVTVAIAAAILIPSAHAQNAGDRAKVLHAAAYALGMARWSDIGTTTTRLPAIDIVNTMEFQGSGTADRSGQPVKVEYHAALGYIQPAGDARGDDADGRQWRAAARHSYRARGLCLG
jgi:hypothetical protein